jgi:hypothetical protein
MADNSMCNRKKDNKGTNSDLQNTTQKIKNTNLIKIEMNSDAPEG